MIFLTVIVPTRNRSKYLGMTLASIALQTYPSNLFEVIVIDNGSTDDTKEIFNTYLNRIRNMRYAYDETPGLHVGRHLGMKMAKSDILVYVDDDIEAFPTWLEGIAESFQGKNVALAGGKNLPKFESEPPEWIQKMWEESRNGEKILFPLSIIDLDNAIKEIPPLLVFGCNFAIRKSVLLEANGFHPDSFPPELIHYRGDGESHVSRYIGTRRYRSMYNPKSSVFHIVPSQRMTEEYFCRRFFQQGISDSYTCIRSGEQISVRRWLKRLINERIIFLTKDVFDKRLQKCYWQGYDFHQDKVKNDRKLYEWVMKKDYF